ncbi:uncharacterized protein LOC133847065 [Drosophila sulfurigaster albostrigata]|uniref:uncharacterized protein LOC133847065 n=1 Tax=Drosophila sulfurigaster albostrigata TaxID=89887 RepID=UPI002D21A120|nr:uncharacterized protein LOC133847065 [Drosophila sulfurigaster albostrigata]
MNKLRVLRSSNILLLLCGYQLHWFDARSQNYRISLAGALNVFILGCFYAGCFAQHFQPSAMLKTLLDVSPFLHRLTRLQLLLSVKVFAYAIYASVRAVGVANALTESLPMKTSSSSSRKCFLEELIAHALLYSTHLVLFCFGLYIGYEMEFKLPPLQDAMIGFALFLPHLVIAGALRFYCTLAWLTRSRLAQIDSEVQELLKQRTELEAITSVSVTIEAPSSAPPASSFMLDNLMNLCQQLQQLATRFGRIFSCLQHSLLLLFIINANCLLFGIYSYTYYSSTWHVLFATRKQRIFYAGNACIYACIACDYFCLLFAQTCLEQQRQRFLSSLNIVLQQRNLFTKRIRSVVKDMRSTLWHNFHFKFLSLWRFDLPNFSLFQVLQLLIIALIVIYHYLNDAIQLINDNLDSSSDNDD